MGAIVAIIGEEGDPELPVRLERMLARSPYRGTPKRHFEHGLALGIQTLGWDASLATVGNWTLAMHGFIGNWTDLASSHGWDFPDGADNATKLAIAYEKLGNRLFATLRGEFAILVYNRSTRELLLTRDVPCQRPLFFGTFDDRFHAATEVRPVLAGTNRQMECNEDGLIQDVWDKHPDREISHVKGVSRVIGGYLMTAQVDGHARSMRIGPFWHPPSEETGDYDFNDLAENLCELVRKATQRSTAGRGIAVRLSGGIDSTLLWLLASHNNGDYPLESDKPHPISVILPGHPSDESPAILNTLKITATKGTLIDASDLPPTDPPRMFEGLVDGVFADRLSVLLRLAKNLESQNRNVFVTGHGANEWFTVHPVINRILPERRSSTRPSWIHGSRSLPGRVPDPDDCGLFHPQDSRSRRVVAERTIKSLSHSLSETSRNRVGVII